MPDDTQLRSARSLYEGDNTVCIAPTGVGKTAIANYVITKNLNEGKKTYYTTPLKALSNDKYREFCKIYGEENVGLLTGDIKLKKDAPVLIMTTEIYRNILIGEDENDLN
jgi:superfamily II RNA helicase